MRRSPCTLIATDSGLVGTQGCNTPARLFALLVVGVFAAGCGGVAGALPETQWRTPDGDAVHEDVLTVIQGPGHCDWQSSLLLFLGWPPGTAARTALDSRQYVCDPQGVLPVVPLGSSLDLDTRLPPRARPAGFRSDEVELWFGPDGGATAVYLRFDDHVERWPRSREFACA
ncbi:hypothetical protein BH24ACT14_BH24ACT14_17730 [soil metagenome]